MANTNSTWQKRKAGGTLLKMQEREQPQVPLVHQKARPLSLAGKPQGECEEAGLNTSLSTDVRKGFHTKISKTQAIEQKKCISSILTLSPTPH